MDKLLQDVHLGMLLKHFNPSQDSHVPSITSLIHCLRKQAQESESSKVVCVDILSEKADCKETLLKVIGSLQKIFIHEFGQKQVVVVGDAKVYSVMQSI